MKNLGKWFGMTAITIAAVAMISCVPSSQSKGKEKMEECGYVVETIEAAEINEVFDELGDVGASGGLECMKESTKDVLFAVWFADGAKAKEFKELYEEMMGENLPEGYKSEVDGKVYYFGSEQACKDFTK